MIRNMYENVPSRMGRGPSAREPVRGARGVSVSPITDEAFLGGRDCIGGTTGAVGLGVRVDDGRVGVVYQEAVAFADDSAEEREGLWEVVG